MPTTTGKDAIALHYQPVAESHGGVVGFEALMRWHHQQRGETSPEAFIPIFEKSGLIVPLSRWALLQACLDAASWRRPLAVSVKLSANQLECEDLLALLDAVLSQTGLPSERLELEMTEKTIATDPVRAATVVAGLAERGVGVVLDDFGAGDSSPALLRGYPFSKIKIDRDFVHSIESSQAAKSIIRMIIELAHSRNLVVAAKGVETAGQLLYLTDQGCDHVQGYLIGQPALIDSFSAATGSEPGSEAPTMASPIDPGFGITSVAQR